jgi:hypothetical protein
MWGVRIVIYYNTLQLTFTVTYSIDIDPITYVLVFNDLILCLYIVPIYFNPVYMSFYS